MYHGCNKQNKIIQKGHEEQCRACVQSMFGAKMDSFEGGCGDIFISENNSILAKFGTML